MEDPVNLLLVDDEARNLDALEAVLDDPSYRLLRADSADAALRQLLQNQVAAIVLDIKMPGISGFELANLIKGMKRYRQIPILFLTAYHVEDEDVLAGYSAGAVDYLTKPIKPQILRHKIAVFADLFRKTRALAELNDTLELRVKQRTEELASSEAALRDANRQKDQFLATLAHELRNPLAPLRTGLDLLIQRPDDPVSASSRVLDAMNRQLDHMVRLIDDLLDVSRISRGVLELRRESCDLAVVIGNAIESARPFIEKKRQVVVFDHRAAVHADVDPTRIAQVIGNLIHNASKFSPVGAEIRVELAADPGGATIRVIDPGIGIPPAEIERAFDMFSQVRDTRSAGAGSGLGIGLALARRLAELHGGTLVGASQGDGRGSVFTLTLRGPAGAPTAETTAEPTAQVSRSARPASHGKLAIVVIEDNDDAADTLAEWLETMGHSVRVARTGPEGVDLVREYQPRLVLCDIGLPGMDGVEVCRHVKALPIGTQPVMVALTGWGMEADRKRTREVGFDHHLVKPVAPDKLFAILNAMPRE
ncbi:MAG TPA: response regulator [Kofleriaceae bacterium]|jgi:signal transduction histidine kinase|nr:response regulator [Kofleriaceae bacterium]